MRVAVAQVEVSNELPTAAAITAACARVVDAVERAARGGARVVVLPEGTLTYPPKRHDWAATAWDALSSALDAIATCAGEVGVWVVVGAPHRLSGDAWPHNSLYVFDDRGVLVTRYDKRRLSVGEVRNLYTPGTAPVTFEVDGHRFGMVLCLEALFPELVVEYASPPLQVDTVLLASASDEGFAHIARGAAISSFVNVAVAFSVRDGAVEGRSGVCAPWGWLDRVGDGGPGIAVADIMELRSERTFHEQARSGALYEGRHAVDDPRSVDRRSI